MKTKYSRIIAIIVAFILISFSVFMLENNEKADKAFSVDESLTSEELMLLETYQNVEIRIGLGEGNDSALFLIERLAQVYDLKIMPVIYDDFGELLRDTINRQIDYASYVSYSVARDNYLDYSEPIGIEDVYLYSKEPISIEQLENKTILVSRGSIFEDYLISNFDHVDIRHYSDIDSGLKALENDEVFAVMGAQRTYQKAVGFGYNSLKINNYIPISPVYLVSQEGTNDEMLAIFSKYTSTKEYAKLLQDYEYRNKYALDLEALKNQVKNSTLDDEKVYEVMLEVDDPYVFYRGEELVGYTVDIVDEVFNLLGLQYEITSKKDTTWDEMYTNLLDAKIDVLGSIAITNDRLDIINFSKPVWISEYFIIQREEDANPRIDTLIDLQSSTIGVVNNDFRHDYLMRAFPNKKFSTFNDTAALMNAFLERSVDYIVLSDVQHTNFVIKTRRTDIEINDSIGSIFSREVAMGFPRNNEGAELSKLFSSAYELIDFNELKVTYFEKVSIKRYYQQERMYMTLLILAITIASAVIIYIGRRKLRVDWPTGTLNRYAFKSDFRTGVAPNKSLIFIDLNKLKQLNDIYGHLLVDKILLEYCKIISSLKYRVYRVGGDEFVIVDSFKRESDLRNFVQFVSEQRIIIEVDNVDIILTASVGVIKKVGDVVLTDDSNSRSYLLSLADHTMYRAKNDPLISVKYCSKEDIESHLLKVEIENIIDKPIEEVGIYPVFQPIYNFANNEIVGFESLARWRNGNHHYMPDQFIPVFENLNKIGALDIFMFEEAIKMLTTKRAQGLLMKCFVTSNFSVKSLGYLKLSDFERVMKKYEISKHDVIIEITESTFFDSSCIRLITDLKQNGYTIAIDDFSSGHSTVNSIVSLEVDVVKIDKHIVDMISEKLTQEQDYSKDLIILDAITKLIKSIDSKVIVEGIETDIINSLIMSFDIDFVQGNYYSLPLKEEDIK